MIQLIRLEHNYDKNELVYVETIHFFLEWFDNRRNYKI